jgi:uncharacterized damage-inducible protein DinB
MSTSLPEYWLRGPVDNIPALLQPIAHTLLQATDEVKELMAGFPADLLWEKPGGVASPGFHLLHMTGVLDRLCTYAAGKPLSAEQLAYLAAETLPGQQTPSSLVAQLEEQVSCTLQQLLATREASLTDRRTVGRKALPSTVQGLLFHAAEHTMRHLGQLLVTVKVLTATNGR